MAILSVQLHNFRRCKFGHLYLWLTCIIILAVTGLVGLGILSAIVNRTNRADWSNQAIVRVVGHFTELVSVGDATDQLNELPDLEIALRESRYSVAGIGRYLHWENRTSIHSGIIFGELIPVRESASAFSKLLQLGKWITRGKWFFREVRIIYLNEIADRQCRRTPVILNLDFKGATDEISNVFPASSFNETNWGNESHGFNSYPRALTGLKTFPREPIRFDHLIELAGINTRDFDRNQERTDNKYKLPRLNVLPEWLRRFMVVAGVCAFGWGFWVFQHRDSVTERTALFGIISLLGGVILSFWSI